ncbi:hypothetical protein NQ315_014079 [Exocentrus adspersus]|uniref:DDE-1 domain-containing protein n=1 Tax=Exocentrus adspersus TaxID=1586481 RepID=A0AAV8VUZ3_9CUCU|nr:hypothetical protein NQ315_014079 [Exocentrus adspersus]
MYAGSAIGELLPMYFVYKGDHLWNSWKEGGLPGTCYNRSRSRRFDFTCFEGWFFRILIGDNLSSHFSEAVPKKCQELNIAFVCLPNNATHILQPLDVYFYAPLKKYWRKILTHWKKTKGRKMSTISKDIFPKLLNDLQKKIDEGGKRSQNLISGFAKTGLYPSDTSRPNQK